MASTQEAGWIEDVQHDKLEPIAIVGFSFKFPQEAISAETFWQMLMEAKCASTDFPSHRLNAKAFYHPDHRKHDSFHFRGGHFLKEDLGSFDAPFFSIKPAEALSMDPLQRKLLEVTYRALENAGIPLEKISGSKTSVYTASFADDYRLLLHRDTERIPKYAFTGTTASFLANRISWFYNLKGPSLTLDTACSGGLVAIDHACQSLRNGDCSMSIVGGGNIILDPSNLVSMSNVNFFSPDSRCFSFDHRANGYSQGEGVGVVVLQRLSDAIRDNNCIRAVIRSTGTSSNGYSPGITRPDPLSQEQLIRSTYSKAGLALGLTRYFEAHATGTALGDPIEALAIGAVFRNQRECGEPIYVGAVKSNIGHLEGGSGLASLIKTILILEKGVIPPNANFERVNPKIDTQALNIELPQRALLWPGEGLRRASLNSFGIGGTNSHVVVDDAYNYLLLRSLHGLHRTMSQSPSKKCNIRCQPVSDAPPDSKRAGTLGQNTFPSQENGVHSYTNSSNVTPDAYVRRPKLLVWSAASRDGLKRHLESYSKFFRALGDAENQDSYLDSLAYTLTCRRSALVWKTFTITSAISTLRTKDMNSCKAIKSMGKPNLTFVFTGQGSQWPGMGRELLSYPVFRSSIENADKCLDSLGCKWSLLDELKNDGQKSNIHNAGLSQPACTAVQVALIDLLGSFGLFPSVVIGHSSGEIAAAYCTGAISSESAWKISYYRGLLSESLSNFEEYRGAMLAVGISADQAHPYLVRLESRFGESDVVVACINSPKSITLSGHSDQIESLMTFFDDDGVFNRKLRVNVAYHSPQMTKIATEYLRLLGGIESGNTTQNSCIMISSLKCRPVKASEVCNSDYWVNNMTHAVKFSEAVAQMWSESLPVDSIVEIGPHSTLQGPIRDILRTMPDEKTVDYSPVLLRSVSAFDTLLECVGKLHCRGHSIDLSKVNEMEQINPAFLTDLPEYPFDDSHTYWPNTLLDLGYRFREKRRNDLLGTPAPDWNPSDGKWYHTMRPEELKWAKDHVVNGTIIYPGAGMIVMAIEAARQTTKQDKKISGFKVRKVMFQNPLVIPLDSPGVEVTFTLRRLRSRAKKLSPWSEFILSCHQSGQWVENCRGFITAETEMNCKENGDHEENVLELAAYQRKHREATVACKNSLTTDEVYDFFEKSGLEYGPAFKLLRETFSDGGDLAIATIEISREPQNEADNTEDGYLVHPTTLDAFIHLLYIGLSKGCKQKMPTTVPTAIQRMWIASEGLNYTTATDISAMSKLSRLSPFLKRSSLFALSVVTGAPRIIAEGIETTTVANTYASENHSSGEQRYHRYLWKPEISLMDKPKAISCLQQGFVQEEEPKAFFEKLTLLLLMFISETLKEISDLNMNEIEHHHQKYIAWMHHIAGDFRDGMLPDTFPAWKDSLSDSVLRDNLCEEVSSYSSKGRFYVEIGRYLPVILQGKINIHELLFQSDLAKDFYNELYNTPLLKHSWSAYLDFAAHQNPRMRILEIGAGTGGATHLILEALKANEGGSHPALRYKRYDFTDISPAFFEKARARFPEHLGKMSFKLFNSEKDPADQGLEVGSYDMVIAFGSIHITHDLCKSLSNARKLLKPGGKLILGEITNPHILRASFAFGLFADWWLGRESYRQWSPSIPEPKWNELLLQSGFSGNDIVINDYKEQACKEVSIIVSTAVEVAVHSSFSRTTIVVEPRSTQQMAIAHLIQSYLVSKKQKCDISSCTQLALLDPSQQQLYIVLLEYEAPILENLDENAFLVLKSTMLSTRTMLWVTGGGGRSGNQPGFGIIDGLSRSLRNENANLRIVTLALELSDNSIERHVGHICTVLDRKLFGSVDFETDQEFMEQGKCLGIDRLVEVEQIRSAIAYEQEGERSSMQSIGSCPPLQLSIRSPGLLETFEFVEDNDASQELDLAEVEVKVKAVGITIMDCLAAMGRYEQGWLGSECSGIVVRSGSNSGLKVGDHVLLLGLDCYRTLVRSRCAVKIPPGISFTDAASIPASFTIAYYALKEVARMQPGESVLVNSAACGVGQACVELAKHLGANVYAVVSTMEEKDSINELFDLPTEQVLLSDGLLWVKGIRRLTNGRGVDVILNALEESGAAASWDCIAPFGRLIEIGPDGKSDECRLRLPPSSHISYSTMNLRALTEVKPELAKSILTEILSLQIAGQLQIPKMLYKYPSSKVGDAFRDLLARNNIGKTVLSVDDDQVVQTLLASKPAYNFDSNATYIISGGLGTCGQVIARWMVTRGARNLILLSRNGSKAAPAGFLETLRDMGVHVETPPCDVSDKSSLESALIYVGQNMPAIKGCIHAAAVINNVNFEKMTFEDWEEVTKPKIRGSWNLHLLLPSGMDFFILLSSMAAAVGFSTQANYAASNTYQDSLARFRRASSERAISLNLGPINVEGPSTRDPVVKELAFNSGNHVLQSADDLCALLDHFCNPQLNANEETAPARILMGINDPSNIWKNGRKEPEWMKRPLFSHFYTRGDVDPALSSTQQNKENIAIILAQATSDREASTITTRLLIRKLASTLSLEEESLDETRPMHTYGVDSLVAVEIRNWIAKEIKADVAIFDIIGGASLATVGQMVAGKSAWRKK